MTMDIGVGLDLVNMPINLAGTGEGDFSRGGVGDVRRRGEGDFCRSDVKIGSTSCGASAVPLLLDVNIDLNLDV